MRRLALQERFKGNPRCCRLLAGEIALGALPVTIYGFGHDWNTGFPLAAIITSRQ